MEFYKASLTKKYTHSKIAQALTFNGMATIYFDYGDYKSSIKCLKKALGIKPDYQTALYNITLVNVRTGRFSKALQSADRLLAEREGSSDFLQTKGFVLLTAGRFDEAISNLKSALDINANNEKAHLYMGVALSSKGEYSKADTFLNNACILSPNDIFIHFARIENSVRSGDKENTGRLLDNLLNLYDKNTIIRSLKKLNKNNIIVPLSQKLLTEVIKTKMPIVSNRMAEVKNIDSTGFEKR